MGISHKQTAFFFSKTNHIQSSGHRTAIRSLAFSNDDSMVCTTCKTELKIWNSRTKKCIRTLKCGYGLQSMFAPGNRHVIVANKEGFLLVCCFFLFCFHF